MKSILNILAVVVFLVRVFPLHSEILDLNLQQALIRAYDNNEMILIGQSKYAAARAGKNSARSYYLPTVSASADWQRYNDQPVMNLMGMKVPAKGKYEMGAGLTASMPLFTGGKIHFSNQMAEAGKKASESASRATCQEVEYYTKALYYQAITAGEKYSLSEESLRRVEEARKMARGDSRGGRLSRMDNISLNADVAMRKPELQLARRDLDLALKDLKLMIGLEDSQGIRLVDKMEFVPRQWDEENLQQKMIHQNPQLAALQQMIRLKQSQISLKKAQFSPDLAAFAAWNYSGTSDDSWVKNNAMDHTVLAGIQVNMELFNGGKHYYDLKQSEEELNQARLEYRQAEKKLCKDLSQAILEYETYCETYQQVLTAEKLARQAYQVVFETFGSGLASRADLNSAEQGLTGARKAVADVLLGVYVKEAEINKLTQSGGKVK